MALQGTTNSGRREIVALQILVGVYLVLRLYFDVKADLVSDEPYYWMWGQHLGWSYFDHPPLHAWLLRLMSLVFGWHPISVRILTWFTLAGVIAIFWNWRRRLGADAPELWFWRTVAIYLSSPLFFGITLVAYNDHLLIFLCLLAVHCFIVFTDKVETEQPRPYVWLYLAALALGLAVLTKYNGALLGAGFLAAFLLRPKLRAQLRTPHPWLAALLAVAMQFPVVYWNLTEGLASFRYHLSDRWTQPGHFDWQHPVNFVILCILFWSPFLVWPTISLIRSAPLGDDESRTKAIAVTVFTVSSLGFLAISCVLDAYFYWNIVAFVGLMPLLTRFMRNPVHRWAHYLFGLLLGGIVVFNFTTMPFADAVGRRDRGSSSNYDWPVIGEHMRAAIARTPADLVGATRYSTTSQLGFVLGTTEVVKLSPEHSQYDYWQGDGRQYAGKSALILGDEPDGDADAGLRLAWLQQHFASLSTIDEFTVERGGKQIYIWRIFRGEGYIP